MWPSVRCALLSERKYGALFNNFSQDAVLADLEALGCRDFIRDIDTEGRRAPPLFTVNQPLLAHQFNLIEKKNYPLTVLSIELFMGLKVSPRMIHSTFFIISAAQLSEVAAEQGSSCDTEHQQLPPLQLGTDIRCLVFPRGDISRFKPAR